MTNNELEKPPRTIDGFEGYEDAVEGGEERASNRIIQGALVRFTNEATWVTSDGEELPADLELVAIDIIRVVQRWHDEKPLETRVLQPGEKFPDIAALNETVPREEWTDGPSGPRGPWQAQHIVYLLDPRTMGKYSFATGTIGGGIAVRDLVDRTQWMRRFRGAHVYPVVTFADVFMNTRFGGRQRPRFDIVKWITLDSGGGVLTPQELPRLENSPPTAPEVKPPSAKEVTDDEIPF
jgi:hypothetical protein